MRAVVPCIGEGVPLWARSCLDSAAEDGSVEPCKRFVAHRHSQFLLEAFFTGDYPNSKARIPMDVSLIRIWIQYARARRPRPRPRHADPGVDVGRTSRNPQRCRHTHTAVLRHHSIAPPP